jgi:hypothetical protein
MIFLELAKFLKAHLNSDKPILNLLPIWLRLKIKEKPASDNAARIIQAEFKLKEIDSSKTFCIIPRSHRAIRLLKLLKEYINVMESTRFSRWLEKVEPKDFKGITSPEGH